MANKGTGFDVWLRPSGDGEAIVARGRKKGVAFQLTGCGRMTIENGRPVGTAQVLGPVFAGLTGRDLILKYSRVPAVPDWQLQKLIDFEVQEIANQTGGDLAADFNLLPLANELTGEDTVLLALSKNEVLDRTAKLVTPLRGSIGAFTPNAVALYNAWLALGPVNEADTVLLAWIGEQSIDIALARGPNLLFARNVSGGLQVLDGAIAQTFNVREERAQKIRRELLNLDPRARGRYGSAQEEKVSHSVQGVAGQLQAALRSTLAFCQSQTNVQDLQLQRAYVCGPGARIRGIDRFLADGAGCPVEVWDPVPALDLSACPPEQQQVAVAAGPELVLALGLAVSAGFDDAYSLEILPEAVKRRRRFLERTVWNVAAAVLALLFLGWRVTDARADFAREKELADQAQTRLSRLKRTHDQTERLVMSNSEKQQRLAQLRELAVPLHSTVRALREVRSVLPEDLWLTRLRSETGPAPWVAVPGSDKKPVKRPYINLQGSGVEITGENIANTVYPKFKQDLEARNVPLFSPSTSAVGGFSYQFKIDYLAVKPAEGKGGGD